MSEILEKYTNDEYIEFSYDNSIFDKIKDAFIANKNKLFQANKIDNSNHNYQFDLDRFLNIIDQYKEYDCDISMQGQIVVYTGNPELTIELLLQSLIKHKRVLLIYNGYMQSLNTTIFSIFNSVLNRYGINNLIYYISKYSSQLTYELNLLKEEIIVIGDSLMEQLLNNNKFYTYRNYVLYCDDDQFDKLKEYIFYYTSQAEYELEIIYGDNIDDVIEEVNYSVADIFILLTSNDQVKDKVKKEVKNKNIYINKNPFKETDNSIKVYI